MSTETPQVPVSARELAVARLKKRREFRQHLVVYLLVNAMLVAVWAMTTPHGFFWPMFPLAGWGIGLVMHGWDTYGRPEPDEAAIARELRRMQRHD